MLAKAMNPLCLQRHIWKMGTLLLAYLLLNKRTSIKILNTTPLEVKYNFKFNYNYLSSKIVNPKSWKCIWKHYNMGTAVTNGV